MLAATQQNDVSIKNAVYKASLEDTKKVNSKIVMARNKDSTAGKSKTVPMEKAGTESMTARPSSVVIERIATELLALRGALLNKYAINTPADKAAEEVLKIFEKHHTALTQQTLDSVLSAMFDRASHFDQTSLRFCVAEQLTRAITTDPNTASKIVHGIAKLLWQNNENVIKIIQRNSGLAALYQVAKTSKKFSEDILAAYLRVNLWD